VCDAGSLHGKVKILWRCCSQVFELFHCSALEPGKTSIGLSIFFGNAINCNDMKVNIQVCGTAESLDEDHEPREAVFDTSGMLQMRSELCTQPNPCA
jgi:hypothetical protein